MRVIDADLLKEEVNKKEVVGRFNTLLLIDNTPTIPNEYMRGYEAAEREYKRPAGEWINNLCSYCGAYEDFPIVAKYCWLCGAKMKDGTEK